MYKLLHDALGIKAGAVFQKRLNAYYDTDGNCLQSGCVEGNAEFEEMSGSWWRPEIADPFFLVTADLSVRNMLFQNTPDFNKLYECGNVFKTQEEASAAAREMRDCLFKFHTRKME